MAFLASFLISMILLDQANQFGIQVTILRRLHTWLVRNEHTERNSQRPRPDPFQII